MRSLFMLLSFGICCPLGLVPAAELELEVLLQTGHSGKLFAVAQSGDGHFTLTGADDNTAILWDTATGRMRRVFAGHAMTVSSVALSSDGRKALTGSYDKSAILWDIVTGQKLQTLVDTEMIGSVALSDDGRRAATLAGADSVTLWDTTNGKKLKTFKGHQDLVTAVSLSADGRRVLTGSYDKTAILWNADTGQRLQTFSGHTDRINCVHLSADGRRALTGSYDRSAILWDVATGQTLQTFAGHPNLVVAVALSGDGRRVVTGSAATSAIWDAASGQRLHILTGHADHVSGVAVTNDGQKVVTSSYDKSAILWDAVTGGKLRSFAGNVDEGVTARLSHNYRWLATGIPGGVNLWDTATGQIVPIRAGQGLRSADVDASRFDGRVLVELKDKQAIFWDAAQGQSTVDLSAHTAAIYSFAVSRDGRRLLTASEDKTAILWDVATGRKIQTFVGHGGWVSCVDISADGRRIVTGSHDKVAILWDIATGRRIKIYAGHTNAVRSVALSLDGQRVLTGSFDKTAILWDAATGQRLQTFPVPTKRATSVVYGVSFGGDGRKLVTCSETGILWDAASGRKLQTFASHTDDLTVAVFSPDQRHLVTASRDRTKRIWDVATGKELCTLITFDSGREWLVVTPEGLFDGSVNAPQYLSYRVRGTLDFVSLDRYLHKYYSPGLLARIMKGERPLPAVAIAKALPPKVRIVSPAKVIDATSDSLTIRAAAESVGAHPVTAFRLLVNGRPYLGQQGIVRVPAPKLGPATAEWTIKLDVGKQQIKVLAENELTYGSSDEVEVRYAGSSEFSNVELPTLYVLAIGISAYPGDRKLDFAAKDALAVAAAYETHSKSLYKKVEVKLLTDADASRKGVFQGLLWLRQNMTTRDYGVFYFAGHGEKDIDGSLFFLPADVDPADLVSTAIHAQQLKATLSSVPGRFTAILDACHSGGIDGGKARGAQGITDDLLRDLIHEECGLVVMCSARGHEAARESPAHGHGIFTVALLEGLAATTVAVEGSATPLKADPNGDGVVTLTELDLFLTERVRILSKGQQHPTIGKPTTIPSFPVSKP